MFGLRLYKLACPWPVEPQGLRAFAERPRDDHGRRGKALADRDAGPRAALRSHAVRPTCIGKKDETGAPLFPPHGALDTNEIAIAIGHRILRYAPNARSRARVADRLERPRSCSGRRSRRRRPAHAALLLGLPAQFLDQGARRRPRLCRHRLPLHGPDHGPRDRGLHPHGRRGRELDRRSAVLDARPRVPEPRRRHLQSLRHAGDPLGRRAKTNITYKILFNDAVAMTGGQTIEGGLTVDAHRRQCAAEGVAAIAIVADDPAKYPKSLVWPAGTSDRRRRISTRCRSASRRCPARRS